MFLCKGRQRRRRGLAATELALLTPPLVFLAVATADFGRIFYATSILANCARNGAFYQSDALYAATSPYSGVTQAALADAGNLSPTPTVSTSTLTDSMGQPSVSVTVSYTFTTIMSYPGIASTTNLARTVQMRMAAATPY